MARLYLAYGRHQTLTKWAAEIGIPYSALTRLVAKKKMSVEQAVVEYAKPRTRESKIYLHVASRRVGTLKQMRAYLLLSYSAILRLLETGEVVLHTGEKDESDFVRLGNHVRRAKNGAGSTVRRPKGFSLGTRRRDFV